MTANIMPNALIILYLPELLNLNDVINQYFLLKKLWLSIPDKVYNESGVKCTTGMGVDL